MVGRAGHLPGVGLAQATLQAVTTARAAATTTVHCPPEDGVAAGLGACQACYTQQGEQQDEHQDQCGFGMTFHSDLLLLASAIRRFRI